MTRSKIHEKIKKALADANLPEESVESLIEETDKFDSFSVYAHEHDMNLFAIASTRLSEDMNLGILQSAMNGNKEQVAENIARAMEHDTNVREIVVDACLLFKVKHPL